MISTPRSRKWTNTTDFLANHPVPNDSAFAIDLLDEGILTIYVQSWWEMCFGGASRSPVGEKQDNTKTKQSRTQDSFCHPKIT